MQKTKQKNLLPMSQKEVNETFSKIKNYVPKKVINIKLTYLMLI